MEWCVPFVIGDARPQARHGRHGDASRHRRLSCAGEATGRRDLDVLDDAARHGRPSWGRIDPACGGRRCAGPSRPGSSPCGARSTPWVSAAQQGHHAASHPEDRRRCWVSDRQPARHGDGGRSHAAQLFTNHMLRAVCGAARTDRVLDSSCSPTARAHGDRDAAHRRRRSEPARGPGQRLRARSSTPSCPPSRRRARAASTRRAVPADTVFLRRARASAT